MTPLITCYRASSARRHGVWLGSVAAKCIATLRGVLCCPVEVGGSGMPVVLIHCVVIGNYHGVSGNLGGWV